MSRYFIYLLAFITLAACRDSIKGELLFIEPNPGSSFQYPYFLFIPEGIDMNREVYIIVEPNNSGFADDDFSKHIEKAERIASREFYSGNYVSRSLQYPLLVPVFPRSMTDWKVYTHALDRDVMMQTESVITRPDEQLIKMFEDAGMVLKGKDITARDEMLLVGFSASGTFVNRFTLIHPEKVFAAAAGGINGLLMMPLDSLNGEELNYPVGTNDFPELLKLEFRKDKFLQVPQFYFMGELDDNDAVPYDDAFDQPEREQIFRLLGEEMQPARWDSCQSIYKSENVNAVFKTYIGTGHEQPESVKADMADFFRNCINAR